MPYHHPPGLVAGFHAQEPEADVPELIHIGEQWAPRSYPITIHTHRTWEFYLQLSGESVWEGPERAYTLRPGCFFATPPAVPHRLMKARELKHHFFFAAIDLATVLTRLPTLEAEWRRDTIICVPDGEALVTPFRQLIREVSLSLPHRALGLRSALDYLVLEASRLLKRTDGAEPRVLRHPAVRRAQELLEHQPGVSWRLEDLARHAGLSANHLAECFTREVGVPPHQYLLQARVARAQEMLRQTDISVTDLALELGFASSQHFAAVFKRLTGQTARACRAGSPGRSRV